MFACLLAAWAVVGLLMASEGKAQAPDVARPAPSLPGDYAGSARCGACHAGQAEAWRGSHHAHAMAEVSKPGAVLGNFDNATVASAGASARFFREGARFVVETDGKDGKPARFVISHSFGWTPLQQYLVTMPDGRLQALPWAWDTRPVAAGGQRWFHVYGNEPIPAGDPRHWTGLQQNANHMCAECHTTGYDKGYRPVTDRFETRWSELGVGCESCHGPGARHVAWAEAGKPAGDPARGFTSRQPRFTPFPAMTSGPASTSPAPASSPSASSPAASPAEVETCARCHARRGVIDPGWQPGQPFMDSHRPVLLSSDMFEHDGQMKDEVFNDHAFRQSLMFAKGVTCGHCHDPHSGQVRQGRAEVCSQCHEPPRYAVPAHTGHPAAPGQPDCVSCHMPARTYMQIDTRHDHSFRIPRPDLTETLGTPNACAACHADKPARWAAEAVARWHGPKRKGFQTFGPAFHASRAGDAAAREQLQALATDLSVPAVARATAVAELSAWPAEATERALVAALADPDPLVRSSAVSQHDGLAPALRRQRLVPLLGDPVRLVRITAAFALADLRADMLPPDAAAALAAAIRETEAAQAADLDRPEARISLALLRLRQGRIDDAETEYRAAMRLDPASTAAAINLADLLRRTGREAAAEALLREALRRDPGAAAAQYALGLSLLRQRRAPEALAAFRSAAEVPAPQARHLYAYGLALQSAGQPAEALAIWRKGMALFPADLDLAGAVLQEALRASDQATARDLAAAMGRLRPDDPRIRRLQQQLGLP